MKKSLTLFLLVMLLSLTGTKAQKDYLNHAEPKFSADTLKSAIDDLTKELSLKHPGFYR